MKIVALLPVKNESWALPSYLSCVTQIADEIIALDDNSTDNSREILEKAGVKVVSFNSKDEKVVNMSTRRQKLLDLGRSSGGTHFIWLDADEIFSSNFILNTRLEIQKLKPGQKISLRWVQAWKSTEKYLDDTRSPLGHIWKDFVFCDDRISNFSNAFLSESRTPESKALVNKIEEIDGVVIHWAYADWKAVQYKQAWYRCTEQIKGLRSAFRINVTYSVTLDEDSLLAKSLPQLWTNDIIVPESTKIPDHLRLIKGYFKVYGVQFFEKLDIWHIAELEQIFIEELGRKPIPQKPPKWFLEINRIKNLIRRYI